MSFFMKKTNELEVKIDHFLDAISLSAIVFVQGIEDYLRNNGDNFDERRVKIGGLENRADTLRREIETSLYSHSLIPDHRGDVLGLLENLDEVIDSAKETLNQFSVETPEIPKELHPEFLELAQASSQAIEMIVLATRAFFKDVNSVKDHLHKVYFYEKEADRISDKLKRHIFQMDIELSHKIHLRYFTLHVELASDNSETVADRLSIYAIKRSV